MPTHYLESVIKQFEYYKLLGEKTFAQLSDEKLFWQYNADSNSIATVVKHLSGNMLSRWTDFLTSDGEKEWRNRDAEFENDISSKDELVKQWNAGWKVFLDTLHSLKEEDLDKTIYIRNQGHSVMEAINRQLAHYPYHIGQIVFIGKMCAEHWNSLSIPKGNSKQFNAEKFAKPKHKEHFTDEFMKKQMEIAEMGKQLKSAHQKLWDQCASMSAEELNKHQPGKWSALQHLQHISKGIAAFYNYLKMDKAMIANTFGVSEKTSRTYDEVFNAYQIVLQNGAVSTPQFNAEEHATISLQNEIDKQTHIINGMNAALQNWTEAELDKYICPHPTMGKLTAREMTYFTIFHAEHHMNSIRKIKES